MARPSRRIGAHCEITTVYNVRLAVVDGIFWEVGLRDLVGEEMRELVEGSPHMFRHTVR